MSIQVDNAFIRQYEADAHDAFQRQGSKLLNTVRHKPNVNGESTTFQVIGTGTATTKARHGVIIPMNQDHTPVVCTLNDFYAGDWVDKLDELKLNIDERQAVAKGGAWALGRKLDDQIMVSMSATTVNGAGWVITNPRTIRNSLLEMSELLDANDVPDDGDRWGLLTPRAFSQALTVPEFANGDFVGDDMPFMNAMKRAQVRTWLGINWMRHTGLPGQGTATASTFAYHKSAVGYGSGASITADITWHGDRASHFVNHWMSGGACLIEDNGVVENIIDDTAAVTVTA